MGNHAGRPHPAQDDLPRPKDLEDVRRLLAANRELLDVAYLQDWRERTLEPGPRRELIGLMAEMGL